MKSYLQYSSLLMAMFMVSCGVMDPNTDVVGSGPVVSRTVDLASFNSIRSTGIAVINITHGETQEITLHAQAEILDIMTQKVTNNMLVLDLEDDVNMETTEKIIIDIVMPDLSGISSEGTGDIYLEGPLQDELELFLAGSGNLYSWDLEVKYLSILLTGTGSAYVHVHEYLDAGLTGTGNIYYKGTPEFNVDITGTGSIISRNHHPLLDRPVKKNITI